MPTLRIIAARLKAYKKWSQKVTRDIKRNREMNQGGWKPPEDFYKGSPEQISQELLKHYDYDKAMSQLNFVNNRSGRKNTPAEQQKLEKTRELLKKRKPVKPGESVVTAPPRTVRSPESTAKSPRSTARTPSSTATKPKQIK